MEGKMNLPKTVAVELTYRCNHRCLFCSCPWESNATIKGNELSAEEWTKLFLEVKKRGVEQITFTGGEAILRNDFFEILDEAFSLGFSLGLISNGKNINDEFLCQLRKYSVLLSISVPGIETFEKTTGVNNIEYILDIFKQCKELGINTVANIAVTKINFEELYENIALPI